MGKRAERDARLAKMENQTFAKMMDASRIKSALEQLEALRLHLQSVEQLEALRLQLQTLRNDMRRREAAKLEAWDYPYRRQKENV